MTDKLGKGDDYQNRRMGGEMLAEDDVEGHGLRREGEPEGAVQRRDLEGESQHQRKFADDGEDDVEGHGLFRGDDGFNTPKGGDELLQKPGPGEGFSKRG